MKRIHASLGAGLILASVFAACSRNPQPASTPGAGAVEAPAVATPVPDPAVAVAPAGPGRGGPPAAGGRGGGRGGRGGPVVPLTQLPPEAPFMRSAPPTDPVIQRMWTEGMERSQAGSILQVLSDSIGARLTGSPASRRASDWAIAQYAKWGIPARTHEYGTWEGWRRGISHMDLIAPRVRSLEGMMLAWSPGTNGPKEGDAVLLPDVRTPAEFDAWLPSARGKWVLTSAPRISCRPPSQWVEFGTAETIERHAAEQNALTSAWNARAQPGNAAPGLQQKLLDAGAHGVITSQWSNYPGINKVFGSPRQVVPTFELSCEDYGLVWRLANNSQGPRLRINGDGERMGEIPVFNTIAEIRGSERPNEYVLLSAHFDSVDPASGTTDNGTGTTVMMEAMRIVKMHYPNPKRTIIAGHWNGEEQGLNGSRAFAEDHPQVVAGLHAGFNQDNGTGRVVSAGPGPFVDAVPVLQRYLGQIPREITQHIRFGNPSSGPSTGGSDHASFQCLRAPVFGLGGLSWDYSNMTWHTNRDTFDKAVIDDVKSNATLVAMLVYLAAEDPNFMARNVQQGTQADGTPVEWPTCAKATRRAADSRR